MFFETVPLNVSYQHETVMLHEIVSYLTDRGQRGGLYVDATLGGGGHAEGLLQCRGDIRVIGLDCDPAALAAAKNRLQNFGDRFQSHSSRFDEISTVLPPRGIAGVVMDLGLSSHQLDSEERGFSFQHSGPLDMRMDPNDPLTAAEILNRWEETDLARIFWELGEERFSRQIAQAIVERRRNQTIRTTGDLADLIKRCVARKRSEFRIHPATRVFQALRMTVNDELGRLNRGLDALWSILAPRGRIAVLSFHSLEDRVVKLKFRSFKDEKAGQLLVKKPIQPQEDETRRNPRSRSAKLRVVEKSDSTSLKDC
jgi:16S rRNA (cytosine1402-N4)-methyltransferase